MKINPLIKVYGDINYRGDCPKEDSSVQTVVNQVRKRYPNILFTHIKNEGKKTKAQSDFDKSMGLLAGVSDLVFFGNPTLFIEMKRHDITKSKWQPNQEQFLLSAQEQGCMVCVALGWEAAMQAVEDWLLIKK